MYSVQVHWGFSLNLIVDAISNNNNYNNNKMRKLKQQIYKIKIMTDLNGDRN